MQNLKRLLSAALLLVAPVLSYLAIPATEVSANTAVFQNAIAGDGFFSPAWFAADSGGNVVGVDCTYTKPCKTMTKALAFQAANIVSYPDLQLRFDAGNGPFFVTSPLIYTSAHTAATGHRATWNSYNGTTVTVSAGSNMNGTWGVAGSFQGSAAQTNAPGACASNLLVSLAPLTEANAVYYVGNLWFPDGYDAQETVRPLVGTPWALVPGTAGVDVGSNTPAGPTATMNGTTAIAISDLSAIGIVGDPILFDTTTGGLNKGHSYFIKTKAAATGSGNITVANTIGGTALTVSTSVTINVAGETQSINAGDRAIQVGDNVWPYDPATPFDTAVSGAQTDVKGVLPYAPMMSRIASVNTGTHVVTQNSPLKGNHSVVGGLPYRVINRPEDLGTNSAVGEMRTDRTTGWIYYTPRAGETCAGINAVGVIAPGPSQGILRISTSTDDITAAGGTSGAAAGNLNITNFRFSHTNSSVESCQHVISGAVCGYITAESSRYSTLDWAVEMVGASNVTFTNSYLDHLAGSGMAAAWGSNHITFTNGGGTDVGGSFIQSGMNMLGYDNFHHQPDTGYIGNGNSAPTTNFWVNDTSVGLSNVDMTGASDSNITISNNTFIGNGKNFLGTAGIGITVHQQDLVTHNKIWDSPQFGLAMDNQGSTSTGNNVSYGGIFQAIVRSAVTYKPSWGSEASYNDVEFCGYATTLGGVRVPGDTNVSDFGCFYTKGPGGDGTSPTHANFNIHHNKLFNVSAGRDHEYTVGNTTPVHGKDGINAYFDGNNTGLVNVHDNWACNAASANIGDGTHETNPTRLLQPTGNAGSLFTNNIFATVQPTGSDTTLSDGALGYENIAGVSMFGLIYPGNAATVTASALQPNFKSYPTPASGNLYIATTTGTTANPSTPPTCTGTPGVTTCTDGTVTWTYLGSMASLVPGGTAYGTFTNNIFASKVTGASSQSNQFPVSTGVSGQPLAFLFANNLYSLLSSTYTKFTSTTTFSTWLATAAPVGNEDAGPSLYGAGVSPDAAGIVPNFVNIDTCDLRFASSQVGPGTASSCSGVGTGTVSPACNATNVGFTPIDMSTNGPQ